MSGLTLVEERHLRLPSRPLTRAHDLLRWACDQDQLPAAALCVGRNGLMTTPRFFGRQSLDLEGPPLRSDALFLVASLTKPLVATAVMMLVERGQLTLQDRVVDLIPAFSGRGKAHVRLRHLLTHTSGLPASLPNNIALRKARRPLSVFVDEVCRLPLVDEPGTRVVYQSTGFALLGEIVRQVSGRPIQTFLREEIFEPLGMYDSWLGWHPDAEERQRFVPVREPGSMAGRYWGWNSPYWLAVGAPWGGMVSSPRDLARFCQMVLAGGTLGAVRLLSPATLRTMTSNQLILLPRLPEEDRLCRPWGLGWRLNWPGQQGTFSERLGHRAFGHWGVTGTLFWLDPRTQAFCVLLTNQPTDTQGRLLERVSDLVAQALL